MLSRYFLAFCLVLVVVAVHVNAQEIDDVEINERVNPSTKIVQKFMAKFFKKAAANCLYEAADNCKQHWKDPKAAVKCGRDYLNANQGRCAFRI